jgi:hypothetical protein
MDTPRVRACSFCLQSERAAGRLIQGPGHVRICKPCVELYQTILAVAVDESVPDERRAVSATIIEQLAAMVAKRVEILGDVDAGLFRLPSYLTPPPASSE